MTLTVSAYVAFLISALGAVTMTRTTGLRCAECSGQLHSVTPWRVEDLLGKPLGRRG
jgi:hypothetical protein